MKKLKEIRVEAKLHFSPNVFHVSLVKIWDVLDRDLGQLYYPLLCDAED